MYKAAARLKLRFPSPKGELTAEQLWSVSINDLNNMAVTLHAQYEQSGGKSFLVENTEKDKTAKLRFDIVLDVLQTKVEEQKASRNAAQNKAHNEKIMSLIEQKKNDKLSTMSVEDLEKMLITVE